MSTYQIHWFDHEGNKKNIFQTPVQLEYVRTVNAIGSLVITFPRAFYQYDQFAVGDMLELWREKNGAATIQNETAYFLQDWEFLTDDDGAELVKLTAFDANWILDTRITWALGGSTGAHKTDYPDDMMKAVVSDQFITNVTRPERNLPITCAPDLSAGGAQITEEFHYENVLSVIQDIAKTAEENCAWVGFDLVRTGTGLFEFRTYTGQRGQDHGRSSGDPRFVGKQYGNFSEFTFGEFHADERNVILVGGEGEGNQRVLLEVKNNARATSSKWNRRELFVDASDAEKSDALAVEGSAALREFRPRQVLTGTLHDTPGMQYGIHYQFGDILSVEAFGYFVDCHVKSVRVKVDQDGAEQLDIKLEGEL